MEKLFLKSDEEYFDVCISNKIGNMQRKYCSQFADIGDDGDSIECNFWHKYVYGTGDDDYECIHVKRKPKSYPCVFVWHCDEGDHDFYYARFVYPEDLTLE